MVVHFSSATHVEAFSDILSSIAAASGKIQLLKEMNTLSLYLPIPHQIKGGRKQEKEEKIFPGYVLVEMIMDEDSWYVVRHTAGVTKFVGSAKKPIPAKDSEIKKIIHRSTTQTQKIEMDVKVGEKVRIISGPFAEFVGDITEVYPDKAKLRAMVSIFGRETPVELEYKQIQKL